MERKAVTKDTIARLAETARLELPDSRQETLAETMDGIFQMLDSLDQVELGETAPAIAFRAKWEGR